MRKNLLIFIILLSVLISMVHADDIPTLIYKYLSPITAMCNSAFQGTNGYLSTSMLSSVSIYSSILPDSLLIVTMVMSVLGIAYAIGYSFGLNSLVAYAKNEMYEAISTVGLVVIISFGMPYIFSLMGIVAQVAVNSAYTSGASSMSSVPSSIPTNAQALFTQTCDNFAGSIAGLFVYVITIYATGIWLTVVTGFSIGAMPNGANLVPYLPGFILAGPLRGFSIFSDINGMLNSISMFIIGIHVGLIGLLFMIYWLFPLFLYLGIILRAFPWTRPAGGAFISLFVSFYIIFPSLLYPFSFFNAAGFINVVVLACESLVATFGLSFASLLVVTAPIGALVSETLVNIGAQILAGPVIEVAGIVIAFVISYDMLEAFGDFFGSPSLSRGRLFNKLV